MDNHLLSTKTTLPPERTSIISRSAFLAQLDEGSKHKFILISAPAGSGKTIALTEWIYYAMKKQAPPHFVWISLDREDNDMQRFWQYILSACQHIYSKVSDLQLYYSSGQVTIKVLLTMLINTVATIAEPIVLVLDNFHTITNEEIHQSIEYLLNHSPVTLRIIITTRYDPPLSLARLRAHDDVLEIRTTHLRFSQKEIASFLNQATNNHLPPADIAHMEEYTDGWIAGLQLIARTMRMDNLSEHRYAFKNFATTNPDIIDYLRGEILAEQPVDIQTFLLKTSILRHFTSDLCAAVTGMNTCNEMLDFIKRANLFLISIDQDQSWYRYNPLFAESMLSLARHHLGQAQMQALYTNASQWYEQHSFPFEAIDMALLAQDFTRTTQLIRNIVSPLTIRFQYLSLLQWMDQLPQDQLQSDADLYLAYTTSLFFTTRHQEILPALRRTEQLWSTENNPEKLAMVFILHALIEWWWKNDYQAVGKLARRALAILPEPTTLLGGISTALFALAQKQSGEIDEAWTMFQEAYHLTQLATNHPVSYITKMLGDIRYHQGKLDQALQYYEQALQEKDIFHVSHIMTHINMSAIYLQKNDIQNADTHLSHLSVVDMQIAAHQFLIEGWYYLVSLQRAQGKREQAYETLMWIGKHARKQKQKKWQNLVNAYQARFALLDGDLANALRWSTACSLYPEDQPVYDREEEYLVLASIMIACDNLSGISEMLERWYDLAVAQKRVSSQLKIQLLQSLAYHAKGDNALAFQYIRKVILVAQPQGFMQIFLEEGSSMALLLRRKKLVEREPTVILYIEALLQSFGNELPNNPLLLPIPVVAALLEQLTQREYNVLLLLVEGKSRKEIAQMLTVSVNTVKTHIKNLYSKLNVNTRKEAIEFARRVHIL